MMKLAVLQELTENRLARILCCVLTSDGAAVASHEHTHTSHSQSSRLSYPLAPLHLLYNYWA